MNPAVRSRRMPTKVGVTVSLDIALDSRIRDLVKAENRPLAWVIERLIKRGLVVEDLLGASISDEVITDLLAANGRTVQALARSPTVVPAVDRPPSGAASPTGPAMEGSR